MIEFNRAAALCSYYAIGAGEASGAGVAALGAAVESAAVDSFEIADSPELSDSKELFDPEVSPSVVALTRDDPVNSRERGGGAGIGS